MSAAESPAGPAPPITRSSTQPVEIPPWGELKSEEYQKERLLETFSGIVDQYGLALAFGETAERLESLGGGAYRGTTGRGTFDARAVVLALGRRGAPRKLGVPGEELPKVMYKLLDAESYRGRRILVGSSDAGHDPNWEPLTAVRRPPAALTRVTCRVTLRS